MRGVPLNLGRRPRTRSWAERYHFAIGLALTLVGLAAVGAIDFLGVKGSLATMIGAFAEFCPSLWTGLPLEQRPDLSDFLDQSTKPVEVPSSRGASLGRLVSLLVVPGPTACTLEGDWNDSCCQAIARHYPVVCVKAMLQQQAGQLLPATKSTLVLRTRVRLRSATHILPPQPRSCFHSQNPETAHGIDESFPFFPCPAVVLRKRQPPLVYFRFRRLNALMHLRPIGFEQGRLI